MFLNPLNWVDIMKFLRPPWLFESCASITNSHLRVVALQNIATQIGQIQELMTTAVSLKWTNHIVSMVKIRLFNYSFEFEYG